MPNAVDPGTIVADAASDIREAVRCRMAFDETGTVESALLLAGGIKVACNAGDSVTVHLLFDKLLAELLGSFGEAEPRDVSLVVPRLSGFVHDPKSIDQAAFPVALVSELLTICKVRIDTSSLEHWKAFAARYGPALQVH